VSKIEPSGTVSLSNHDEWENHSQLMIGINGSTSLTTRQIKEADVRLIIMINCEVFCPLTLILSPEGRGNGSHLPKGRGSG